ncbi:MAG TPA: hypothetical protein VI072_18490 [Polyangiaceae bacterium]
MIARIRPLFVLAAVALLDCKAAEAPPARSADGPGASDQSAPEPPTAGAAPSGKRAPCTFGQDQTCNDDPKVSALWGRCTELGVCECQSGFALSPTSKRCAPEQ